MGLLGGIRADRLINKVVTSGNLDSAAGSQAVSKLREIDSAAVPRLIELLSTTRRDEYELIVNLLSRLARRENLKAYFTGLEGDDSNVINGVVEALKSVHGVDPNQFVTLFDNPRASKPALLAILSAHSRILNAENLLRQTSKLEHNDLVMLFRIIDELADESLVPKLVARIDAKDPVLRAQLARILARFPGKTTEDALFRLLKDGNKAVRLAALEGLSNMGADMDIGELCQLLRDSDFKIQSKAIDAIVKLNHPRTVQHLLEPLKDDSEYARRAAVEVLNQIGDADSIKDLLCAAKDDDWWVRSRAADALGNIGGPRVVDAVMHLVRDEDRYVRRTAMEIMVSLITTANREGGQGALEQSFDSLVDALSDADWWVRERAVDGLAELRDRKAVPVLIELLQKEAMDQNRSGSRPGALAGDGLRAEGGDEDRKIVPVIIRALAQIKSPEAVAPVLAQLRNGDETVKKEALEALRELSDETNAPQVIDDIGRAVRGDSTQVRELANSVMRGLERLCTAGGGQGPGSGLRSKIPAVGDDTATVNGTVMMPGIISRGASRLEVEHMDPSKLKAGDVLAGRYEFVREVGKGAFGTVYLMQDRMVREEIILKFLNPQMAADESVIKRFIYELRFARKITHPNVIRIFDMISFVDAPAISMEYFPSHTLNAEIHPNRPMDTSRALNIMRAVCAGMASAHHASVVHRDLKPSNILINDEDVVKIVDFGVAAASRGMDTRLTRTGLLIGTPTYMAPEQVLGKDVDARTDIYCLGVIMYEMLTGSPPYAGGDSMSIMYQHVQGSAEAPRKLNPDIPHTLNAVILKAMATDPDKRYQSMDELQERIGDLLG